MNYPAIILAVLGIAAAAGVLTAYYRRSEGKETISLLETNITAYKDSEKLKDARIAYLQGQLVSKDETINNLNELLKKKR